MNKLMKLWIKSQNIMWLFRANELLIYDNQTI